MSMGILLAVLLVWTVAGLLAAIAFGKLIQETTPEEEQKFTSSNDTDKFSRKNKTKQRESALHARSLQHGGSKRASG